jgi:Rrf2 family protein
MGVAMRLSRSVSYALQAILQLAGVDSATPVPCSQIAAEGRMPERFLLQILRDLVAHGVLESTRGVDGGYTLERDAKEVTLLEVIEAVEGPLFVALPVSQGLPEKSKSRVKQALADLSAEARRELGAITLAQLMPEPAGRAAARTSRSSRAAGSSRTRKSTGRRSRRGGKKG